MAGRKTENQNGLKYKIERKPQGNIEIPAFFAMMQLGNSTL